VPRRLQSGTAIISADIQQLEVATTDIEQIASKIAEVVTKWNVHKSYVNFRLTGKKENEGNCQDFVEDMLKALNCKVHSEGAFKLFMDKMRVKGVGTMEFEPTNEFKSTYGVATTVFTRHDELDNFVAAILKKNRFFMQDHPDEWKL